MLRRILSRACFGMAAILVVVAIGGGAKVEASCPWMPESCASPCQYRPSYDTCLELAEVSKAYVASSCPDANSVAPHFEDMCGNVYESAYDPATQTCDLNAFGNCSELVGVSSDRGSVNC